MSSTDSPRQRAPRPPRKTYRVVIVVVGLLLAANVWYFGGANQRTNKEPVLPSAIEQLIPKPGDVVSPQSTIEVDLRKDLQGVLQLNGTEIPLDQLRIQATEGIIQFTPGPTQQFTTLPQGSITATVLYWPRGVSESHGTTAYTWQFKVGA